MAVAGHRTITIRRRLRHWPPLIGMCAFIVLVSAGTAAAAPSPNSPPAPALTSDQEIAAQALSRDFHVPPSEARARIHRQTDIDALSERLPQQLGAAYAGTFIDNAHGGRAVVLVATPQLVRQVPVVRSLAAAHGLPAAAVEVRQVRHSLAELATINRGIGDGLARLNRDTAYPLSAWVDIANNRVVIGAVNGAPTTTAQESFVAANQARYGDAVARGTYGGPAVAAACSWPSCDPPMRGGLWISAGGYNSAPYCTSGFPARSRSDSSHWYVVTAGHCYFEHPGVTWAEKEIRDHTWHTIGTMWHAVWDSRGDAAIITMNNPAGWSPQGWVYVRSSTAGDHPTAEDPAYAISRIGGWADVPLSGSPPGYYVCHTGATFGTDCGTIGAVGVTLTYDGHTVQGLARVTGMAGCQGDSGGPVFVSHTAFGIYVALDFTSVTKVGPNGYSQKCGVTAYYQGANGLQDLLNVNIVLG
jgi:hypothetical protein